MGLGAHPNPRDSILTNYTWDDPVSKSGDTWGTGVKSSAPGCEGMIQS